MIKEHFHEIQEGKFKIEFYAEADYSSSPNDTWGIWKRVERHEAGVTIKHPEWGSYWQSINECETPKELSKAYSDQGRENPSREAYESLQRQLVHYTSGYEVYITYRVSVAGVVLTAGAVICTDVCDQRECCVKHQERYLESVKDYFDMKSALEDANKKLEELCAA